MEPTNQGKYRSRANYKTYQKINFDYERNQLGGGPEGRKDQRRKASDIPFGERANKAELRMVLGKIGVWPMNRGASLKV